MGFFDRFRPSAPTPAQTQIADSQKDKDKSVLAAGSIYYVKWTDKSCTTSDTVKFYNEHESWIFVNECKSQGYYVSTWTESLHEQVQSEVDRIKAELDKIYKQDIERLQYQLRTARTDCRSLQASAAYKSDVGKLQSKVNALTQERDSLKHQIKQLQEQASKQDNSKNQEQERKQVKALARKILAALDCSKVSVLAEELEHDKDFAKTKGNLQGRLIAYYAHKIINT
jgi:uncharacterized phage infection (PIP) family protein YhgE